jgi:hypothetical protein
MVTIIQLRVTIPEFGRMKQLISIHIKSSEYMRNVNIHSQI